MEQEQVLGSPLLSGNIKEKLTDNTIVLACGYAGCGSGDSWPEKIL